MLLLLICFVGVFIFAYLYSIDLYENDKYMRIPFGITFGIIGGLILWGIVSYAMKRDCTTTTRKYVAHKIYSLDNDTRIYGDFFLGCGYINEYEYYFFYQENERGNLEKKTN